MGSFRITPSQKEVYWTAVREGLSMAAAARLAGFSYATAKTLAKKGMRGREYEAERAEAHIPDTPIPLDDICDEAKAALADRTGWLWCKRYWGYELSPFQMSVWQELEDAWDTPDRDYQCLNAPPGLGKALALDTPIPTPAGWSTIKDLRAGDEVFDETGRVCRVVAKSEVFYGHDCYEVRADDGPAVIANAAHEWVVRLHGHGTYGGSAKPDRPGKTGPKPTPDGRHVHTTEFLARARSKRAQLQMADPLELPDLLLPVDPYVLGAWLGDGDAAGGRMTCSVDDAGHMRGSFEQAGYRTTDHSEVTRFGVLGLPRDLRRARVLDRKHIPGVYFRASARQRLALLQGLIDTDGYVDPKGCVEFSNTNRGLAEGVQQLVHSLGAKAGLAEERAVLYGKDCGPKFRVTFYLADAARLPRKANRCRNGVRTPSRYLTVTPVESVPTQCIQVDSPSHLFLAGEGLLVTHNSTVFVMFASKRIAVWRAIRVMFMSRASSLAVKNTGRLRRALERSRPAVGAEATLSQDFGRFKPRTGGDVWKRDEYIVEQMDGEPIEEKEATVTAFGFEAEWLGNRIDLLFGDDLDSTRSIRNMDTVASNRDIYDGELEPRIAERGLFVIGQQRLGAFDFSNHVLSKRVYPDDDGSDDTPEGEAMYRHVVYKVHYDDRCLGRETHKEGAPAYPDGCLLDPRRMPWRDVRKAMNNAKQFKIVYQQEDPTEDDALVQMVWVNGGRGSDGVTYLGCWDNDRSAWELPEGLSKPMLGVITVDPSPTRFWSIQAWVIHPVTEQRFLLDLHREKMDAPDFLDWSSNLNQFTGLLEDWWHLFQRVGVPLSHVIVEINAAQRFMLQYDHFHRWTRLRKVLLVPHNTARNKADPDFGIQMIATPWRHGQVRLPGNKRGDGRIHAMRLVDEVTRWPNTTYDDCVLGQWFLEHNMTRLVRKTRERTKSKLDPRRPSWAA